MGTGCLNDDFCFLFLEMLKIIAQEGAGLLPDMELAFNTFISPRIWTLWEDMEIIQEAANTDGIHIERRWDI